MSVTSSRLGGQRRRIAPDGYDEVVVHISTVVHNVTIAWIGAAPRSMLGNNTGRLRFCGCHPKF